MLIEARQSGERIELPSPGARAGSYTPVIVAEKMAYVSGQIAMWNGEQRFAGEVGTDVDIDQAIESARLSALNVLSQLKASVGDLEKVKRCLKLTVFIRSSAGFTDQPRVANGASDAILDVLGEAGNHARSAVGVAQLPFGASVEVEAIFVLY